jgi:hypothetical protein
MGARAQYTFEEMPRGVSTAEYYMLSFSGARLDRAHAWCGGGSLRLDATFNDTGRRNFFGRLPYQTGQVVVRLPYPMNFTNRTVTLRFYVEGPSDVRLSALLNVIHHGRSVPGPLVENLVPGRWYTISHKFGHDNSIPGGTTSPVTECNRIALNVYGASTGRSTWTGAVYIDDLEWR